MQSWDANISQVTYLTEMALAAQQTRHHRRHLINKILPSRVAVGQNHSCFSVPPGQTIVMGQRRGSQGILVTYGSAW